jgi:hypothetical protein
VYLVRKSTSNEEWVLPMFLIEFERNHPNLVILVSALMLLIAILGLVLTGIVGIGRTSPPSSDTHYFYAAGLMWLDGGNPYDWETYYAAVVTVLDPELIGDAELNDIRFVYPPTAAPFFMALALFDFDTAKTVILVLNLLSVAALAFFTVAWLWRAEEPRTGSDSVLVSALLVCIVIVNPFTTRGVWIGQVTLPFAVLLIAAWYFARRDKEILAGILFGLVAMKPQTAVLPALWFLLEGRYRLLSISAVLALLFVAYPVAIGGPIDTFRDWLSAIAVYNTYEANALGFPNVVGLPSLLVAAGLPKIPVLAALLIVCAITALLWRIRHRLCRDDQFGILMALHCGAVYVHSPELVLLAPAAAALWMHLALRPFTWIWLLLGVLVFFVPERIFMLTNVDLLVHRLTIMTLATFLCLLVLSLSDRRRDLAILRPCSSQ